ncbi:MAG: ABC transporter permease, partial [Saprospiraceae bacterium]|nr:ABC transporter permease [Saprospiraceae bacterium]
MKIRLLADIAISLLLARFKQTLVAAIGVTFSITMFISLLGFMEGLNTLLDNLVLNRTPHIRLYNELQPSLYQPIQLTSKYINYYHFIQSIKPKNERLELYNSQAIMQALRSDNRVLGIAPKTTVPVFYNV